MGENAPSLCRGFFYEDYLFCFRNRGKCPPKITFYYYHMKELGALSFHTCSMRFQAGNEDELS